MFAFIPGLGGQEILLLGFCCFGTTLIGAIVLVVVLVGRKRGGTTVADLENENRRLRDELRRAKDDGAGPHA